VNCWAEDREARAAVRRKRGMESILLFVFVDLKVGWMRKRRRGSENTAFILKQKLDDAN
jgi:hypothetical protein